MNPGSGQNDCMSDTLLVLNAGSSSVKFSLFLAEAALEYLIEWLQSEFRAHRPVAVGHRVVHGGDAFDRPVGRLGNDRPVGTIHSTGTTTPAA